MYQCGLLVPLSENSEMGLFDNLFIDIGDEQSIENDLSTYTPPLPFPSLSPPYRPDRDPPFQSHPTRGELRPCWPAGLPLGAFSYS